MKQINFILTFIIASMLFSGCQSKQNAAKTTDDSEQAALTVRTTTPQQTPINKVLNANGNVAAWQESSISSETNGLLLNQVLVNIGDNVKRGQVLAKFSTGTIEAELAQTQANIAEAEAAVSEASSNANRARSIQGSGAISQQQVEQYITAEASARAKLKAAQANVKAQTIRLKQTTVTAPDDGIISQNPATVGTVYGAGQELFRLIRKGRIEWRADLTAADLSQIKVGMKAEITLPDGKVVQGVTRTIAPSIDTKTRNAIVYVNIPANSAKIGMFAHGAFILGTANGITLPYSAIVMRDGFAYVMQVENNNIKQVKVQLGQRIQDRVEVLNLAAKDAHYVESGGAFLSDGDHIRVASQTK